LQALVGSNELTPDGAEWMIQALDPFHDRQRSPSGYPDTTVGASFVEVVKLTKSVTVPVGTVQDIHVCTIPQLGIRDMWSLPMSTPTIVNLGTPTTHWGAMGTVNILQTVAGSPTFPYYDTTTSQWVNGNAPLSISAFDLSLFMTGDARLIGLGFEVNNTTAELLKSGSVVTYRSPQSVVNSALYTSPPSGAVVTNFIPIVRSTLPPATQAAALLLSGSQQWEAYDGAYVVATMQTQSNPIGEATYFDQFYEPTPTSAPDSNGNESMLLGPRVSTLFPNTSTYVNQTPWNTAGAYFAGLQGGTVLTVNVTAYIECFPQADEYAFMTLTHPSSPFDPTAIEMYSRAAFALKPGTKVANNADGDHWKVVQQLLNRVTPRLGRMAGSLGRAAGAARSIRKAGSEADQMAAISKTLAETKIFGKDIGERRKNKPRAPTAPNATAALAEGGGAARKQRRLKKALQAVKA